MFIFLKQRSEGSDYKKHEDGRKHRGGLFILRAPDQDNTASLPLNITWLHLCW